MKFIKADEMEIAINYKAMRLAYVFVTVSLVVWLFIEMINIQKLPLIQFGILSVHNIIFHGSKLYLTKKMTGGLDEE